jgi:hypothetical protein
VKTNKKNIQEEMQSIKAIPAISEKTEINRLRNINDGASIGKIE